MPNYLRAFRPGGTFYLTLVTERRAPIFATDSARSMLHDAIANCLRFHSFTVDAIVVLPDHLHMVITLPDNDANYSLRIASIKAAFTRAYLGAGGKEQTRSTSRVRHRTRAVWLKRFWEHTVRNVDDLNAIFNYIHYNPVKHGHVACPHAWPHSSLHRFVTENRYARDWCCQCESATRPPPDIDTMAHVSGE